MSVPHGDVRFYNNVFVQQPVREGLAEICKDYSDPNFSDFQWDNANLIAGTLGYNGYMKEAEWKSYFEGYCGEGSKDTRDKYYMPLPVWTGGNVFFNGAQPCDIEADFTVDTQHHITLELKEENGEYKIVTNLMDYLPTGKLICSDTLGMAFEPEERFETPDGEDILFDTDFYGVKRPAAPVAGPFCKA